MIVGTSYLHGFYAILLKSPSVKTFDQRNCTNLETEQLCPCAYLSKITGKGIRGFHVNHSYMHLNCTKRTCTFMTYKVVSYSCIIYICLLHLCFRNKLSSFFGYMSVFSLVSVFCYLSDHVLV